MESKNNPVYPDTDNTIAIDFDGVIHNDSIGFNNGKIEGKPVIGAILSLGMLKGMKYKLVIFSTKCRYDRPLVDGKTGTELIIDWLERNGMGEYIDDVTAEKPPAFLYIDDKGYRFENWTQAVSFVMGLRRRKCLK